MKQPKSGGGWPAIRYTLRKSREAGGLLKMWRALRSKNACKTCALGMGGQQGGMVNEQGRFPEVCKKSLQAMTADMQGAIPPTFWKTYSVAQLAKFTPRELESSGRLATPLRLAPGATHYQPIDWTEALDRVVKKLKTTSANDTFWYFSGRSSNEAGFLLQLFARIYGTNHVNNCSYYCHQASGVGLTSTIGTGTATLVLEDVEHADLIFVIGGNPASNHPRLMTTLMKVRQRGGKVIVINPVVETGLVNFRVPSNLRSLFFGTEIATTYIQPHIGGDLALLTGIAKRLDEIDAYDKSFLDSHCDGSQNWLEQLRTVAWNDILSKSGVDQAQINSIAEIYAQAKNVVFSWTMGITHHEHGVQNVQAIANLALMRGMVGRPNAGLLPIRGHSNVQGIGSVGVTPQLKDAIFQRLEQHFNINLPTTPGLDTLGCIEACHDNKMQFGFCLGGNLFGSNPDSKFAEAALSKLSTLVFLNTTLNTGHTRGLGKETLLLPVLARDEEPESTTQESMFNYLRLSDGGPQRLAGPKSELEIIGSIAEGVLGQNGPLDWMSLRHTSTLRTAIAKVIPGYESIAEIGQTKKEFQISGRTFHQPQFATKTGRARLHTHELPPLRGGTDELRLMTVRSEGQFNTVVYEEQDLYRGQQHRNVILLHPDDIHRLGLKPDAKVTVKSCAGELPDIVVRNFSQIRAGNALMYYPEANVLVPRSIDAQSRTPAFKGTLISISK